MEFNYFSNFQRFFSSKEQSQFKNEICSNYCLLLNVSSFCLQNLFHHSDVNENGSLSDDELQKAIEAAGNTNYCHTLTHLSVVTHTKLNLGYNWRTPHFLLVSLPGMDVNGGIVGLMMFWYSGFSTTSLEEFITVMLRLDRMSGK